MPRAVGAQNTFLQALLKLIPSEIIAVYLFVQGIVPKLLVPHLIVAGVLVAITPAYLRWATGVRSRAQLAISTLSVLVWIYAMGAGPLQFVRPPYYESWHGAVLLAIWTLVPPMVLTQTAASRAARRKHAEKPGRRRPAR
jgi:hypothetical protein